MFVAIIYLKILPNAITNALINLHLLSIYRYWWHTYTNQQFVLLIKRWITAPRAIKHKQQNYQLRFIPCIDIFTYVRYIYQQWKRF